jgi:hypothetical protein
MGNNTEFEKGVHWLSENLTFDVDARINLYVFFQRSIHPLDYHMRGLT